MKFFAAWYTLLPLILPTLCVSQTFVPYFQRIGTEQGLPQNSVQCIVQDRYGFMWFGTRDGLARYDGYHIVVYRHEQHDSTTLSHGDVRAIYEDRSGTLWVGTRDGGLNRFDRITGKFYHYRHHPAQKNSISHNDVRIILEDRHGFLWIGTVGGGLNTFDPRTGIFTHYSNNPTNPASLSDNKVLSLLEDRSGVLWIGTANGLNQFHRHNDTFTRYQKNPLDPYTLRNNNVWALLEDEAGGFWVGTYGGGLHRFDRTTGRCKAYQAVPGNVQGLRSNNVLALIPAHSPGYKTGLWVGTYGGGLHYFDPKTETFTHYNHNPTDPNSLSNDNVFALRHDHRHSSGGLWIGTDAGGVTRLDHATYKFQGYRHIPLNPSSLNNNNVVALLETQNPKQLATTHLWVGTYGGGLNSLNRTTGIFHHYIYNPANPKSLSDDRVRVIQEDRYNARPHLWIGTWGGLNHFDPQTGIFTRYQHHPNNPQSLSHNRVLSLLQTSKTTLWVGTDEGLNRFNPQSGKFLRYLNSPSDSTSLSNDVVNVLMDGDSSGGIWVGTWNGLNLFNPATGKCIRYQHNPADTHSISNGRILSILNDNNGVLWVGTSHGLNRFNRQTRTFTRYSKRDGMPNDAINGLMADKAGNLWITTNRGLCRFSPITGQVVAYDKRDGLQDLECNPGSYHHAQSGHMYFGGIGGFNEFIPEAVIADTLVPPVTITRFSQFNHPVQLDSAIEMKNVITLRHSQNDITFEFVVLHYRIMDKNLYRYTLQGFDKNWSPVRTERTATYTNLDPGEYTFRVQGCNSDGTWNTTGATITVIILPPWWQEWWAQWIFALCFAGLLYTTYRWRINALARHNERLEQVVRERTAELKATNLELALANEEISRQMEIQTEQAREVELANTELHEKNLALDAALLSLQQTQAHLVHSEKMSVMGQITAGIMHEINNPNAAIYGAAQNLQHLLTRIQSFFFGLLDEQSQSAPEVQQFRTMIQETTTAASIVESGSERIKAIVYDLQYFTKHQRQGTITADPAKELLTTIELFRYRYTSIVIQLEVQNGLRIAARWSELNQVVLTLCINAAEANASTIIVEAALQHQPSGATVFCIIVRDNGNGMNPETQNRAFEPFFTTKPIGQGQCR